MNVLCEMNGGEVVNVYPEGSPLAPPDAITVTADPAILGAVSLADYAVVAGELVLDATRIDNRKASELRPKVKRELRRRLKQKIKEATGITDDDELMLAIATAPQPIQTRIDRVRTRLASKDTDIDALDRAALEAFDPETEVDWT